MDNVNNIAKLYRGDDFEIGKIKIKQPTINEIIDFGEDKYWGLLYAFISTTFDMVAQLNMVGIDFTEITNYELFLMLSRNCKLEDTQMFFGEELDFTKSVIVQRHEEVVLIFPNGIEINQYTYKVISDYLRKVHNIPKPKYTKIANEFTKQKTIEVEMYKYQKTLRQKNKATSSLVPLISSLVVALHMNKQLIMNMKIYEFFEIVKRVSAKESADNLYHGLYAGTISADSLNKKDLNWMRELK